MREAIGLEPAMHGAVLVMKDLLHLGPIKKEAGQKFSELRTDFWQKVMPGDKDPVAVDDLERLLGAANELSKSETAQIWIWMAPWPADTCMYLWTLQYMAKHLPSVRIVSIAGLPFLDGDGKIYFPKTISEILPMELVKARRLARPITTGELETDGDDWRKLTDANAPIRTLEGGKKMMSRDADYYDAQLAGFCTHQFQKAARIVNQAMAKFTIPTGDVYLGYRLRQMAEAGRLELRGDGHKTLRDFELKLPGEDADTQMSLNV